jgi:hypothetical protein
MIGHVNFSEGGIKGHVCDPATKAGAPFFKFEIELLV